MGWKINNSRILYENDKIVIYPTAEEIYSLNAGILSGRFTSIVESPKEELGLRFSRIGAQINIQVFFEEAQRGIFIYLTADRGEKSVRLLYSNDELPDSIVIGETWYNLLSDYEEISGILKKAGIHQDGSISLGQYIKLKKLGNGNAKIRIDDQAEKILSCHPVKDRTDSKPIGLKAKLYPYQQEGYQWMRFIVDEQCGCILGDEMGLGKTLQVITLIADRIQEGRKPSLVVAPVSLLENWRREFEKFTM